MGCPWYKHRFFPELGEQGNLRKFLSTTLALPRTEGNPYHRIGKAIALQCSGIWQVHLLQHPKEQFQFGYNAWIPPHQSQNAEHSGYVCCMTATHKLSEYRQNFTCLSFFTSTVIISGKNNFPHKIQKIWITSPYESLQLFLFHLCNTLCNSLCFWVPIVLSSSGVTPLLKKWLLTMFLELPLLSNGKTCRRDGKKSFNVIANLAQPSCN